jgi:hypothetical protein
MKSSFADVAWLQPMNQLVPMTIRDTDMPPTLVLGKAFIDLYPFHLLRFRKVLWITVA